MDSLQFLSKVLLLSILLSALIKYAGPSLSLSPTPLVSLSLVLGPALIMAGGLIWLQGRS